MTLTDYLDRLAEIWCSTSGRTRVALGTLVAKDGKFFGRLEGGMQPRLPTFEKFLGFFRDGSNWPDNVIPLAAADLLDRLENIAVDGAVATGSGDDLSRGAELAVISSGLPHPQADAA